VACTYSDAHYGGTAGKGSTTNVSAKLTQGTQITSDYKRLEYPQDASITIENGFGGTSTSATCKGGGDGTDATSLKDGTAGSRGYCTPSTYGYSTTSGVSVSPSTIEIVRSFDKFLNWYGAAGSAGEAKTLLFPKFRAPIVITLGAGGAGATSSSESGEDGGATTIQYEGETSPFFVLEGGLGGGTLSAPGRYTEVTMQKPYYLNDTGFLYFVKERLSGFSTLSGAENIPESSGAGGHGGFTIFRNLDSLLYKYTVGSYNIGNSYVWEYADNPVVCGTGSTTEKYCSGMNGTNGALVIVW
jgi:hypothetical protein